MNAAQLNYFALNLPMGGWKASGLSARHGAGGIRKYCRTQSLLVSGFGPQARAVHVPLQRAGSPGLLQRGSTALLYGRGTRRLTAVSPSE